MRVFFRIAQFLPDVSFKSELTLLSPYAYSTVRDLNLSVHSVSCLPGIHGILCPYITGLRQRESQSRT
jgi:hypothetical protein